MSVFSFHTVNDFFESYARALENYDVKLMTLHYNIPCSFLSDEVATVFTQADKLEGFFTQGVTFYKQYGIVNARPEIWSKRFWTDNIVKVKLIWHYFDINNNPIYSCHYQYILRKDKNEEWKIEMAVSINEKQKMEEWLANRVS